MSQDGSMSAAEYLAAAAALNAEQQALNERRRELNLRRLPASRAAQAAPSDLAAQFQSAVDGDGITVTFTNDDVHGATFDVAPGTTSEDIDLTIRGVAHLPTRARAIPQAHANLQSMTDAMRAQQDSGEYPTVEDHLNRLSPAWELIVDEMGNSTNRRLTLEEENAIRYRTG